MNHGDFTELAKYYENRPGYSMTLLRCLEAFIGKNMSEGIKVADIGAGTGKLTRNLENLGLTGFAVEPNDAMRTEGINVFESRNSFKWLKGSAEVTTLPDSSVDWVLMGSSFHWTNAKEAIQEFYRILKPGGYFTAIWNPRDIASSELHQKIENLVYEQLPNMKRVSSGGTITMEEMKEKLLFKSFFTDLLYMESPYYETMTKERYLNTWKSVNDIQVQAGKERFQNILDSIEKEICYLDEITVPYCCRAWTVKTTK